MKPIVRKQHFYFFFITLIGLGLFAFNGCDAECSGDNPFCRRVATFELSCPSSADSGDVVVCEAKKANYDTLRWTVTAPNRDERALGQCKDETSCPIDVYLSGTYSVHVKAKIDPSTLGTQGETKKSATARITVEEETASSDEDSSSDTTNTSILDTNFGNGAGYVVFDDSADPDTTEKGADEGKDLVWNSSDSSILVTGYSFNDPVKDDMLIWKLSESGNLDVNFNGTGKVVVNNTAGGNLFDQGHAIQLSGNSIFVTGYSDSATSNTEMVVWKVKSDGTPDTGFDGDGNYFQVATTNQEGNDLYIDSGNNIVVVGEDLNSNGGDLTVWRVLSDGTALDGTFSGGAVSFDNVAGGGASVFDTGYAIAASGTGMVAVGKGNDGTGFDMIVEKLSSTGASEFSFAHPTSGGYDGGIAEDTAVDSNNNIYVVGALSTGGLDDMAIWRLTSTGSLDTNWHNDGIVLHNSAAGGSQNDRGLSITLYNSKVIVTGYSENSSNKDMAVWVYDTSGNLDTSFNGTGFYVHNSAAGGNGDDQGNAVIVDTSGRILITGKSSNGTDTDMVVWRLNL